MPTISLHTASVPASRAAAATASKATCGGVTSMSTRFIDTCASPSTRRPRAFTAGKPPDAVRTFFAIALAIAWSPLAR